MLSQNKLVIFYHLKDTYCLYDAIMEEICKILYTLPVIVFYFGDHIAYERNVYHILT